MSWTCPVCRSKLAKKPPAPKERCLECEVVILHLCKRSGFRYNPGAKGNTQFVHPAHQSASVDLCLDVIDWVVHSFKDGPPRLRRYLCPATIFGPKKFQRYLEEMKAQAGKTATAGRRW